MNECKHRWVEQNWGRPSLHEGTVMYYCYRCHQCRIAQLLERS